MKHKSIQNLYFLGIVLALSILLTACQASPEKASKPSADWSRGVEAGNFVTGSIGIVADGEGERVHLIWPANLGEGTYLRYVQLDAQANAVVTQNLELPGLLRTPRLASTGGSELHLLWGSRQPGEKNWEIWYSRLDTNGNLSGTSKLISQAGMNAGNFVIASDHLGGVVICWDSGASGEIYLQHLAQSGELNGETSVITSQGAYPSLWVEPNGNMYLAWQTEGSMVYGRATLQSPVPSELTVIAEIPQGTGKSVQGPYLGIAGDWAYVFWSILNQSGLEAGTGYTVYTTFPATAPTNTEAQRLMLSPSEEQPYVNYQGSLSLTQLAPPVEVAWASTDFILSPNVMQGSQSDELAVALAINQEMRLDQHLQIAVAIFQEGQFTGYTVGTKTENISDDPVLFVDTGMHLHLAWREGAAGNSVYYSTTQPVAIASLERLDGGDILNAIFQGGMEGLVGITFLPIIGFGWLLPGMLIMVLVKLFRDQDVLTETKYWIPLVISILIYYFVKFATLPTISTYVPFSAWIDIPSAFGAPLRIIIPLLIFIVAILVADMVRRRKSQSATVFYITFVLVDALLTLAIYGVNFLGSY